MGEFFPNSKLQRALREPLIKTEGTYRKGRPASHFQLYISSVADLLCAHFRSEKWNPKRPQRVIKANGTERGQPWSSLLRKDVESSKWACTSLVIPHLAPRDRRCITRDGAEGVWRVISQSWSLKLKYYLVRSFPQRITMGESTFRCLLQRRCWCLFNHVLTAVATTTWDEGHGQTLLLLLSLITQWKSQNQKRGKRRETADQALSSSLSSLSEFKLELGDWKKRDSKFKLGDTKLCNNRKGLEKYRIYQRPWSKKTDLKELCSRQG